MLGTQHLKSLAVGACGHVEIVTKYGHSLYFSLIVGGKRSLAFILRKKKTINPWTKIMANSFRTWRPLNSKLPYCNSAPYVWYKSWLRFHDHMWYNRWWRRPHPLLPSWGPLLTALRAQCGRQEEGVDGPTRRLLPSPVPAYGAHSPAPFYYSPRPQMGTDSILGFESATPEIITQRKIALNVIIIAGAKRWAVGFCTR